MTSAPIDARAVNLLVPLDVASLRQRTVHHAIERLDARGVRIQRFARTPEHLLAWIDAEFGGTWSSEALAGGICVASDIRGPLGFAAFDARGLRFGWLEGWRSRPDVGVFGPFGVVPRARGQGIAEVLLAFALFSLRERGYDEAIVPMVRGRGLRAFYERKAHARIVECIAVPQGERRWKTTVLASGNGSNFQAVLNAVADLSNPLGLEVAALVCNRPGALALERAAKADVRALLVPWDRAEPRAIYDATLLEHVAATQPDLILLLGWMHVLAPEFVERFPDALNIHPAFLPLDGTSEQVTMPDGAVIPAFRGARAVDELFAAGVEWGGATVHRVGVAVDRGEVLARAPLRREPGETKAEYLERLHELEHRVLISAVRRWCYERAVGVAVPC